MKLDISRSTAEFIPLDDGLKTFSIHISHQIERQFAAQPLKRTRETSIYTCNNPPPPPADSWTIRKFTKLHSILCNRISNDRNENIVYDGITTKRPEFSALGASHPQFRCVVPYHLRWCKLYIYIYRLSIQFIFKFSENYGLHIIWRPPSLPVIVLTRPNMLQIIIIIYENHAHLWNALLNMILKTRCFSFHIILGYSHHMCHLSNMKTLLCLRGTVVHLNYHSLINVVCQSWEHIRYSCCWICSNRLLVRKLARNRLGVNVKRGPILRMK
jgi:hypothetical protein